MSPPESAVSLHPDALQVQAQAQRGPGYARSERGERKYVNGERGYANERSYANGDRSYAHGERSYAPGETHGERRSSSPVESVSSMSEEELTGAVGQLSLNEDEQVRYHGKASGLHLLGDKERVDGRNKGGIWCVLLN